MPERMTPKHRNQLRDAHAHITIPGRDFCRWDRQDWPCEVVELLDALDAIEAEVDRLRAQADAGPGPSSAIGSA